MITGTRCLAVIAMLLMVEVGANIVERSAHPVAQHPKSTSVDGRAWQPGFAVADLDGLVGASAVFDDGTGPALYVAGEFTTATGTLVNRIARWDGDTWSELDGPSGPGVDGWIYALAVYDDGTGPALYAGGYFFTAGATPVNNIARWDGTTWSTLAGPTGSGVGDLVSALTVFDDGTGPALFAGGWFDTAGGVTANHIAKWNGAEWSNLTGASGIGIDGLVFSLAVHDDGTGPALFAGGWFNTVGGVTVNGVTKWDGSDFSPLSGPSGIGTDGFVYALMSFDDGSGSALYVGGHFDNAGGVTANGIARWHGGAFSALSGGSSVGVNGWVDAFGIHDDGAGPALYVGGTFDKAGGSCANNVVRWDGSAFTALSGPSDTGVDGRYAQVSALSSFDDGSGPALFVSGEFAFAGGVTTHCIARWDGSGFSALTDQSGSGMNDKVMTVAVYDGGSGPALFAGGTFDTAGGAMVNNIASWDGAGWSALTGPSGIGADGVVRSLAVFDDGAEQALYGGGNSPSIIRWDGALLFAIPGYLNHGSGAETYVDALAAFDDGAGPALYAAGSFRYVDQQMVRNIARWDGSAWSALTGPSGTGIYGSALALAVFDDGSGAALYAGGSFPTAGGVTVNGITKWDGTGFSALSGPSGTGVDGYVRALVVFDDGSGPALYAGGQFTTAGGVTANGVAKWDGTAFSALAGPSGTGLGGYEPVVQALSVYDDGKDPVLIVGGGFSTAGGLTVDNVAEWDGANFVALGGPAGTGIDGRINAMVAYDDGTGPLLFAGGHFAIAGGLTSNNIAAWRSDAANIFGDDFESMDTAAWSWTVP